MALALPLLAGFVLAPLLGGRWSRIGRFRLRLVWLFYVAIALQLIAFPVKVLPWHTSDRIGVVLWLISYGLFAAAVAANFRIPGIPLIAAGLVSNLLAITTNGGHMPALPSALRAAGLHFATGHNRNSAVLPTPHVAWLVDRWAAPSWVPLANVFSVGDVLIMAGGLLFALGVTGALDRPVAFLTNTVGRIRQKNRSAELRLITETIDALELLHERVRQIEEHLQEQKTDSRTLETHTAGVAAEASVVRLEARGVVTPIRPRRAVFGGEGAPSDEAHGHVCLVPTLGGYELLERAGGAPMPGTVVDLGEGLWGEVVKLARSPLPNDKRTCAYLLQAAVEEDMLILPLVSSGS
jgi:hypothetical protein